MGGHARRPPVRPKPQVTVMYYRFVLLLCAALTYVPPQADARVQPAPAEQGSRVVSGGVVNADGKATPVSDALVTIATPEGLAVMSARTTDDGRFEFAGLR